jgi:hypothetical protein
LSSDEEEVDSLPAVLASGGREGVPAVRASSSFPDSSVDRDFDLRNGPEEIRDDRQEILARLADHEGRSTTESGTAAFHPVEADRTDLANPVTEFHPSEGLFHTEKTTTPRADEDHGAGSPPDEGSVLRVNFMEGSLSPCEIGIL